MTIILAIPANNAVIFASDGQITAGEIRTHGKKIQVLNNNCMWGAAGRGSLIQRVDEKLSLLQDRDQPLVSIKDKLSKTIRDCTIELFSLDRQPPQEEFVFVEYREKPVLLHVTTNGTPEFIKTGPFGIGIGRMFVHALLQKYADVIPEKIDMNKGAILAYKVIEEAIEVGAYGLGPPIDVWMATKAGIKNLNTKNKGKLKKICDELRYSEIMAFLK